MDRARLIDSVGREAYEAACAAARREAADPAYGRPGAAARFDSRIAHDLSGVIWDADLPESAKLRLTLATYEEMPCYAYLFLLAVDAYDGLSPESRAEFWAWVRATLGRRDLPTAPLEYALDLDFLDPLNDEGRLAGVLDGLMAGEPDGALLRKILSTCGAVPKTFRPGLYGRVIRDRRWLPTLVGILRPESPDPEAKQFRRELRDALRLQGWGAGAAAPEALRAALRMC